MTLKFVKVLRMLVLSLIFTPLAGRARAMYDWPVEKLEAQSTLICEGTVDSIKQVSQVREFVYGDMKTSEVILLAKIHVTQILKGKTDAEIEFRYRSVELPTIISQHDGVTVKMAHGIANDPRHIKLDEGMKFRFYLTPAPDHHGYISVIEGDPDDFASALPVT